MSWDPMWKNVVDSDLGECCGIQCWPIGGLQCGAIVVDQKLAICVGSNVGNCRGVQGWALMWAHFVGQNLNTGLM
jgi:hypothetical protein